jgi:hypothetical protein
MVASYGNLFEREFWLASLGLGTRNNTLCKATWGPNLIHQCAKEKDMEALKYAYDHRMILKRDLTKELDVMGRFDSVEFLQWLETHCHLTMTPRLLYATMEMYTASLNVIQWLLNKPHLRVTVQVFHAALRRHHIAFLEWFLNSNNQEDKENKEEPTVLHKWRNREFSLGDLYGSVFCLKWDHDIIRMVQLIWQYASLLPISKYEVALTSASSARSWSAFQWMLQQIETEMSDFSDMAKVNIDPWVFTELLNGNQTNLIERILNSTHVRFENESYPEIYDVGPLEPLHWLVDRCPKFDAEGRRVAPLHFAWNIHLVTRMLARHQKFLTLIETQKYIAFFQSQRSENMAKIQMDLFWIAAFSAKRGTVEWLYQQGFLSPDKLRLLPSDSNRYFRALPGTPFFMWLKKKNLPFPSDSVQRALTYKRFFCLTFLLRNGQPWDPENEENYPVQLRDYEIYLMKYQLTSRFPQINFQPRFTRTLRPKLIK